MRLTSPQIFRCWEYARGMRATWGRDNNLARQRIIALCLLLLSLGSCGSGSTEIRVTTGTSDRWLVGVSGPRGGSPLDPCLKDPAIEESYQSTDLPSTHLSIELLQTATKEDAERIADCLRQRLTSGNITIHSPRT
jgi:hypothetical protein